MGATPTLTFRNGHRVVFVERGVDEAGEYLRLQHILPVAERQAGPHWHPVLTEQFTVRRGRIRFKIDGTEVTAGPGDTVTAPAHATHEFWTESPDTILDHEIRPPLHHWQMFTLWRNLDAAGKTTPSRIPRNPLALALLWHYQDGYLSGIPTWLQHALFGTAAKLAKRLGYERRWLKTTEVTP